MRAVLNNALGSLVARYIVNGLLATAVHFCVLVFNLEVIGLASAGIANGIAAVAGIATSFFGSRYFVFRAADKGMLRQGVLFLSTYAVIAMLHVAVLYVWTDRMSWDYRVGFILATGMQMAFSFIANKLLVFK